MFVWNHFTNDARVMRECTALADAGYLVNLVAIYDPKIEGLKKKETIQDGFTVVRVSNQVWLITILAKLMRVARKSIFSAAFFVLMLGLFVWLFPLIALFVIAFTCLLMVRKVRVLLTRGKVFLGMVWQGTRKRYDIYHSNDLNTVPQGILSAKIFHRSKLIYDSHEVQTGRTGYDSSIYGWMERKYLRFVDTLIHENHTRAKHIEELYGIYPKVVHNYPFKEVDKGDERVELAELLGIEATTPILLYQGGIQIGRGLDKLIEAIPSINKGVLVFIGDGRIKPSLEKMVQENGLESRVKFLPKVPAQDLFKYTRNAFLGFQVLNNVCFNHYSASSNKLFEYIMCSVPVIACSFPEIQKVVEGEEVGICVDSHDPISIANGVNYLLEHPNEYMKMKENCLIAREKYNWSNEKDIFLKIVQETL